MSEENLQTNEIGKDFVAPSPQETAAKLDSLSAEAAQERMEAEQVIHFGPVTTETDKIRAFEIFSSNPDAVLMLDAYSGGQLDVSREAMSVGAGETRKTLKVDHSEDGRFSRRPILTITENGRPIALATNLEKAKEEILKAFKNAA